jgi:predicted amidohydrolase
MSWSVNVPPTQVGQLEAVLDTLKPAGQDFPEALEQLEAAKACLLAAVNSGALGAVTPETWVSGYMGGHANLKHEKTPGWANDFVSCTVQVADPPVVNASVVLASEDTTGATGTED